MPFFSVSSNRVVSGTTATARIQHGKSGIVWIVSQISVRTTPVRNTAQCTVNINGSYRTSTSLLPSSAQGTPFYALNPSDVMTVDFTGLAIGDVGIVEVGYDERGWGQYSFSAGDVI